MEKTRVCMMTMTGEARGRPAAEWPRPSGTQPLTQRDVFSQKPDLVPLQPIGAAGCPLCKNHLLLALGQPVQLL